MGWDKKNFLLESENSYFVLDSVRNFEFKLMLFFIFVCCKFFLSKKRLEKTSTSRWQMFHRWYFGGFKLRFFQVSV